MVKLIYQSMLAGILTLAFACFSPQAIKAQNANAAKSTIAPQPPKDAIAPSHAMVNYNPVPAEPSTVKNFPAKQPDWLDTAPKLPAGAPPVIRKTFPNAAPANKNIPPGEKDKTGEKQ